MPCGAQRSAASLHVDVSNPSLAVTRCPRMTSLVFVKPKRVAIIDNDDIRCLVVCSDMQQTSAMMMSRKQDDKVTKL